MGSAPNYSLDKFMGDVLPSRNAADRSELRKHFVAATGEFTGTFLFLFISFLGHSMAVSQSSDAAAGGGKSSQTIVIISLSYAMSLLCTAWTLYRISGGLFNPSVTIGMMASGTMPVSRGLVLIPMQFLGAMAAAGVTAVIIPGQINAVQTVLAPEMNIAQGLFLEMFLTAQLVFTILMLAAEKSKITFIAPLGIGLALFSVLIAGGYYTGASVNPARSFGPCVVATNFHSYHWIYWLGPTMGSLLAAAFYRFVKFFNYADVNPGQDFTKEEFDELVASEEARLAHINDLERQATNRTNRTTRTNGQVEDQAHRGN